MGTYVIGGYIGHDASLAIVGEGRILHYELERFNRQKHSSGDVFQLFEQAIRQFGIESSEIVAAVGSSGALAHTPEAWTTITTHESRSTSYFGPSMPAYVIPHHLGHAAYAYYTSPFVNCGIIAIDGGGDAFREPFLRPAPGIDCVLGHGDEGRIQVDWQPPQRVGGMWHQASDDVFGQEFQEGSLMALAGVQQWERTGFDPELRATILRMQALTTTRLAALAKQTGDDMLALAGGVALNGIAVYALLQTGLARRVHVPPAVHDGGIAVGGALYVLHQVLGVPLCTYTTETIAFAGYTETALEPEPDAERIADALASGQIVAVAHGRAESGPRALGHRSILADPRRADSAARVNQIKSRQPWRPVAPAVLRHAADQYFTLIDPQAYAFMTCIASAHGDAIQQIPAALHEDGSARVQVVDATEFLGKVCTAFAARTGVPVVLNTSFNGPGVPLVNTADEARAEFERLSDIDALAVGSEWVTR